MTDSIDHEWVKAGVQAYVKPPYFPGGPSPEERMRAALLAVAPMIRAALSKRTECRAHQFSDLMICEDCGLEWDTNDPTPPECPRAALPPPPEVKS